MVFKKSQTPVTPEKSKGKAPAKGFVPFWLQKKGSTPTKGGKVEMPATKTSFTGKE